MRPPVAQGDPEGSIQAVQFWPRPFAFEHGDLLSKSENLEGGITPTAKENSDGDNEGKDEFERELIFVTCRNVVKSGDCAEPQVADFKSTWSSVYGHGASDATLMAVAGHMSRRILEHYSHVRMAAKRTALDKLESGRAGHR